MPTASFFSKYLQNMQYEEYIHACMNSESYFFISLVSNTISTRMRKNLVVTGNIQDISI